MSELEQEVVICPHCGKRLEEKTKTMGFSVICPHCKKPA